MMKQYYKVFLALTFLTVSIFIKPAMAAGPVERAIVACEYELTHFCATVTPGEGRLMMCLGAYEDKISLGCGIAVYEAAVAIDVLASVIAAVGTACGQEIVDHCATAIGDNDFVVEAGQGQVVQCLASNQSSLGESCNAVLAKLMTN